MQRTRIIIPVRVSPESKTRLSCVLSRDDREALVQRMFRHVLGVAVATVPRRDCFVVSEDSDYLAIAAEAGAKPVLDPGLGLNSALESAVIRIAQDGPEPVLALFADLPWLGSADLTALMDSSADVVCARDQSGTGANGLWMRCPGLLPYRFGEGSFAAHVAECRSRALELTVIDRAGLARDLDDPATLAAYLKYVGEAYGF